MWDTIHVSSNTVTRLMPIKSNRVFAKVYLVSMGKKYCTEKYCSETLYTDIVHRSILCMDIVLCTEILYMYIEILYTDVLCSCIEYKQVYCSILIA